MLIYNLEVFGSRQETESGAGRYLASWATPATPLNLIFTSISAMPIRRLPQRDCLTHLSLSSNKGKGGAGNQPARQWSSMDWKCHCKTRLSDFPRAASRSPLQALSLAWLFQHKHD